MINAVRKVIINNIFMLANNYNFSYIILYILDKRIEGILHAAGAGLKMIQTIEIYNHLNSNQKSITLANKTFYKLYSKLVSMSIWDAHEFLTQVLHHIEERHLL